MTTDNLDLDHLEGLLGAATPSPWEAVVDEYSPEWALIQSEGRDWHTVTAGANFAEEHDLSAKDANLIVALVNAAPGLIAAARAVESVCDGGCSYGDGPDETCSAHGRPVAEVWDIAQGFASERDVLAGQVAAVRELHHLQRALWIVANRTFDGLLITDAEMVAAPADVTLKATESPHEHGTRIQALDVASRDGAELDLNDHTFRREKTPMDRSIDTAHAVAIEREEIAKLVEHYASNKCVPVTTDAGIRVPYMSDMTVIELAYAIRDGAHNAHNHQKRRETGQDGVLGANAGTSDTTDDSAPAGAETRGKP